MNDAEQLGEFGAVQVADEAVNGANFLLGERQRWWLGRGEARDPTAPTQGPDDATAARTLACTMRLLLSTINLYTGSPSSSPLRLHCSPVESSSRALRIRCRGAAPGERTRALGWNARIRALRALHLDVLAEGGVERELGHIREGHGAGRDRRLVTVRFARAFSRVCAGGRPAAPRRGGGAGLGPVLAFLLHSPALFPLLALPRHALRGALHAILLLGLVLVLQVVQVLQERVRQGSLRLARRKARFGAAAE